MIDPRGLALAAISIVLILASAEGVSGLMNRFDPPKGSFCVHCRQVEQARRENKPWAGPHGVAPLEPPAVAARKSQPPFRKAEDLDFSRAGDVSYVRDDKPYHAVNPGSHRSLLRTRAGELVYDVHYTIDSFGRRVVPDQDETARRKFLLLFGCSLTYGEGVEDRETLEYQLSRLARGYRVYNYGMSGHGPGDIVLRLRDSDLKREVPEKTGVAAYIYYDAHLARAFGSMSLVSTWGANKPYFEEGENGEPRFLGSFQDARPWTTRLYQALWHSQFLQRYRIELPLRISDAQLELYARLIQEMKDRVHAAAADSRFVVVMLPGQRGSRLLIPFLERLGIEYVNYGAWDMGKLIEEPAFLPHDGHPTPRWYQELATHLWHDLGLG